LGRTVFVAEVGNFLAAGAEDEHVGGRELLAVVQVNQVARPAHRSSRSHAADREAMINPHVLSFAPRLRWQAEGAGWNVLAFTYIPGARHADYSPGSADVPAVIAWCAIGVLRQEHGLAVGALARIRHVHASTGPGDAESADGYGP